MKHGNRLSLGFLLLLAAGLGVVLYGVQFAQDIRNRAAVPGGIASVSLTPASRTWTAGERVQASLTATIVGRPINGVQVSGVMTGTVPGDFTFVPATPPGLTLATLNTTDPVSNGRLLRVAFITKDPMLPFVSTEPVVLGTMSFTAPSSGALTLAFDWTLTKIIKNDAVVTDDIVGIPVDVTYTFVPPAPTPAPNVLTVVAILTHPDGSQTTIPGVRPVGITRFEQADGSPTMPRVEYAGCMANGSLTLPIASGGSPCTAFAPGRYATKWPKKVTVAGITYTLVYPNNPKECTRTTCEQSEMITGGQPIHRGMYQASSPIVTPNPKPKPKPTKPPKPTKVPRQRRR